MKAVSAAFQSWQSDVANAKHDAGVLKKCLRKLTNRQLAGAFMTWSSMVAEARRHRELLTKCLRRVLMKALSAAFQTWCAVVDDSKNNASALETTLKKTVGRMRNMKTAGALLAWQKYVQTQREHRATIVKCLKRITDRHVAAAWASWRSLINEARRHRELLKKCMSRIILKALSAAFQSWRAQSVEAKRMGYGMAKILKRMTHGEISAAFHGWQSYVQTTRRNGGVLTKCLYKLTNRQMFGAYMAWVSMIAEQQRRRELLTKFLTRMENRGLLSALSQWSAMVRHNLQERERAHLEETEEHYRDMMGKQVLGRWVNKLLATMLLRWFGVVQTRVSRRQRLAQCIVHMQHHGLSHKVFIWREQTRRAASAKDLAHRSVTRMTKVRLTQSYSCWAAEIKAKHRLRALLSQLTGKTANRALLRALRAWKQHLAAQQKRVWEGLVEGHAKTQIELIAGHTEQSKVWEERLQNIEQATAEELAAQQRALAEEVHTIQQATAEEVAEQQRELAEAHMAQQSTAEELAAQQTELAAAQAALDLQKQQATAQQEQLEQSKQHEVGGLQREVVVHEQREQELEAENRDLEQHLSVLAGLEGKISSLFGELETVSAIITSPPPPPLPPASPPSEEDFKQDDDDAAADPAPQDVPNAMEVSDAAAMTLATLVADDVIAFDLSHGGMLRLGTMDQSYLAECMFDFIRPHWVLFVSADLSRDQQSQAAGRSRDQPAAVVLGRGLLLAAGMPVELAKPDAQVNGRRVAKELNRLYDVLAARLRWWRGRPIDRSNSNGTAPPPATNAWGVSPRTPSPETLRRQQQRLPRARSRSRSPPRPAVWGAGGDPAAAVNHTGPAGGGNALDRIFAMMEDKKLRLRDLFNTLDEDGSGSVDAAELVAAFARHGVNATVDEVTELLDTLDVDGNNHIDITEFLPQMRAAQNERRRLARRSPARVHAAHAHAAATAAAAAPLTQGKLTTTRKERKERAMVQRSASKLTPAAKRHVARMRELA